MLLDVIGAIMMVSVACFKMASLIGQFATTGLFREIRGAFRELQLLCN